jgi:hypothetical protein
MPGRHIRRALDRFKTKGAPGAVVVSNIWLGLWLVALRAGNVRSLLFCLLNRALAAMRQPNGPSRGIITVMAYNATVKPGAVTHAPGVPPEPGDYVLLAIQAESRSSAKAKGLLPAAGIDLTSLEGLIVTAGGGITCKTTSGGIRLTAYLPVLGLESVTTN